MYTQRILLSNSVLERLINKSIFLNFKLPVVQEHVLRLSIMVARVLKHYIYYIILYYLFILHYITMVFCNLHCIHYVSMVFCNVHCI